MTNAIAPSMRRLALLALLLAALPAAAQEVILRGALSPATAVSPTESKGTGEVAAVLGEDNVLRLDMIFAGVDPGASRAALHIGKYNETGPMQQRLDIDEGATSGRLESVEISLTPLTAASVRAGESYVVIGTIESPEGALRAQLMPQPVRLDQAPASLAPTQAPVAETRDPTPAPEPEEEN